MRKILFFYFILVAALIFAGSVYAQDSGNSKDNAIDATHMPYDRTPLNKLGRGLINTLTCWVEIPAEAVKVGQEKDPLTGCTLGVVEGFVTGIIRGATGIFDVATFMIPPYNKPIMKPEYALTSAFEKFKEIKKSPVIIKDDTDSQ